MNRYLAVNVQSNLGGNRYRLIGLASESDKTDLNPPRGKCPRWIVITTEDANDWTPVVNLSIDTMRHRLIVDCAMAVEQ